MYQVLFLREAVFYDTITLFTAGSGCMSISYDTQNYDAMSLFRAESGCMAVSGESVDSRVCGVEGRKNDSCVYGKEM